MSHVPSRARFEEHYRASLAVLADELVLIEEGPEATGAGLVASRARMNEVLWGYQAFKHEQLYNPAVASSDPVRAALGRDMKVICIGAGEVFRGYLTRWTPEAAAADWAGFSTAARLTMGQLRRHVAAERDGILRLLGEDAADQAA